MDIMFKKSKSLIYLDLGNPVRPERKDFNKSFLSIHVYQTKC